MFPNFIYILHNIHDLPQVFFMLSTTIRLKLSMNSLFYTSKAGGKYILKIRPSHENTHFSQLPGVDKPNGAAMNTHPHLPVKKMVLPVGLMYIRKIIPALW